MDLEVRFEVHSVLGQARAVFGKDTVEMLNMFLGDIMSLTFPMCTNVVCNEVDL